MNQLLHEPFKARNITNELGNLAYPPNPHRPQIFPKQFNQMGFDDVAFLAANNAGGFVPTDIAGLKLWLDAAEGITKDGSDFVSAQADQSGIGNNVAQGTGANQPLWVDSIINGLPVIRYDGINDALFRTAFVTAPITTGFSVYMVAEDNVASDDFWFDGVTDRAAFQTSGANYAFFTTTSVISTTPPSGDAAVIFRLIYDGASSSLFKDGASIKTGNDGGGDMDGVSLASNASQGANRAIDIADYLIYDSVLSAGDNTSVMDYLTGKYAL